MRYTPQQLHEALDLLLAQYLCEHRDALPSKMSVLDLCRWAYDRLEKVPPSDFDVKAPCHWPPPVGPTDLVPLRDALLADPRVMLVDPHVGGRFLAEALRGAGMREHVDAHHPGADAEALAVLCAHDGDREAWLAGYRFEVSPESRDEIAQLRQRIAELEASESEAIVRAGNIIGGKLESAERLAVANAAVRDACKLFERMACDDHRHPPDDHVALETWKLVCEWQERPVVMAAMEGS